MQIKLVRSTALEMLLCKLVNEEVKDYTLTSSDGKIHLYLMTETCYEVHKDLLLLSKDELQISIRAFEGDLDYLIFNLKILLALGVTELILSGCDAERYAFIMNTLQKHGVII